MCLLAIREGALQSLQALLTALGECNFSVSGPIHRLAKLRASSRGMRAARVEVDGIVMTLNERDTLHSASNAVGNSVLVWYEQDIEAAAQQLGAVDVRDSQIT
jgi:hypothetical protein